MRRKEDFHFKPGDLVQHKDTGQIGVLVRSYEVPNDSVPWEESYIRCVAKFGLGSNEIMSTPQESLVLMATAAEVKR